MGTSEGSRAPGRGRPGWFRAVGLPSGGWTLLDPEDQPFLLRAVHGVRASVDGDDGVPPRPAATLLRGWGFNADGRRVRGTARFRIWNMFCRCHNH